MKFKIKQLSAKQEYYSQRKGEPYRDNNKAYIWVSGESVLDNLMQRYNRPHTFYKKEVLPAILKEVAEKYPEFRISTDVKNWGWRQKCGCSTCGCSPGFIQTGASGTVTISADVEFIEE